MKVTQRLAIKLTMSALVLYLLGFFLLYPLFAKYTAGDNPGFAIAISAKAVHQTIYQPLLTKLGPEHPVSVLWLNTALWWCNRINGLELCREKQE